MKRRGGQAVIINYKIDAWTGGPDKKRFEIHMDHRKGPGERER